MVKGIHVDIVNVPSSRLDIVSHFAAILIIAFVFVNCLLTTYVEQAKYKIPIQYTKVAQGAPSSSYLPQD